MSDSGDPDLHDEKVLAQLVVRLWLACGITPARAGRAADHFVSQGGRNCRDYLARINATISIGIICVVGLADGLATFVSISSTISGQACVERCSAERTNLFPSAPERAGRRFRNGDISSRG